MPSSLRVLAVAVLLAGGCRRDGAPADLTGPGEVTALTGVADTRRSIRIRFTAPSDDGGPAAGYVIRYATAALTEANFAATGDTYPSPVPASPGTAEEVRLHPLRTGTAYWVGVVAVDQSGNRSAPAIVGPLTPRFDASAVYAAPNTAGDAAFGYAMARGRFDADTFEDLAVSSPFATADGQPGAGEVYVYSGSASGLAATPSVTIRGTTAHGNLGASLTRVRWSSATHDDLVIGEPFAEGSGAIHVFDGGAAFPGGTVDATSAPRHVLTSAAVSWFTGSALGWRLATTDHDGDGTDDLAATAIFGDSGAAGAVIVLYGGTVPGGTVRLSDVSAAGSGTTVARMYEDAGGTLFGYHLHDLGPTQGPADAAGDLAAGYAEDGAAGGDLVVLRATGGRPASPGVTREPFTVGRDVRVRRVTTDPELEWGSTVSSIEDQNGDGARELVLGDFRDGGDAGVVYVLDGDTVGAGGVTSVPGSDVVATLQGAAEGDGLGMAVVGTAGVPGADVDGDGHGDLVAAARAPGTSQVTLQIWFGPLDAGAAPPPGPGHVITGPAGFAGAPPAIGGSPITAAWIDVNGDGLPDLCWADWTSSGLDGGVQVLWDDGS